MDRALVVRAQAGDRDAFSALASASLGRLNAVARLTLRDDDVASDAVQDALVEAWRCLRGLRDPDRFVPWLDRLLIRACYDRAKRDRRRRVTEVRLIGEEGPSSSDSQAAVAMADLLTRGLARLPVDQRAVIVLTYYLDLPIAECAAALGIPIGTCKSRLHRSLAALRAAVDADERRVSSVTESVA